jgi:CSLREA domain-containing protein
VRAARALLIPVVAAVLACAFPAAGYAQTQYTVTRFDDPPVGDCLPNDCSLREALDTFETEIVVLLPAGGQDYVVDSQLGLGQVLDVTIRGTGSGLATIRLNANSPQDRVISAGTNMTLQLSRVRITGGRDDDQGGGIEVNDGATLRMSDSEVVGNTAPSGGGIWSAGTLVLDRTTVAGNEATGDVSELGLGGGIAIGTGGATLTNTTVSGNRADQGGGIHTQQSMTLRNVSLVGNTVPAPSPNQNGGALFQQFPTGSGRQVIARNTLIARNVDGSCGGTLLFPIDSNNGLLDELNRSPGPSCNTDTVDNFLVANAMVAPSLAQNGGLTRTHALLAGSPAINAGASCLATDQRGVSRPQGAACDIGAYEATGATPPSGPPPDEELPDPVPHKNVNALPKSGTVKIKLPGSDKFVELTEGQQIPLGTTVDVRRGRVTIVAAAGAGQTADFYGGIFKLTQTKGSRPITVLSLVEKLSCPTGKASTAAKKKRKRRLWGDGRGRFRTKGRHSAATVVGTKWLVEDKCRSTLTRVVRGRVRVRDFVKKKNVIVKAGKKYVARAR